MQTTTPTWTTGDRLRKARESVDLSVAEMAELLDVTRNTVTNYEHNRTRITASAAVVYSEATSAPIDWLLGIGANLEIRCFREDGDLVALHDPNQRALFTLAA